MPLFNKTAVAAYNCRTAAVAIAGRSLTDARLVAQRKIRKVAADIDLTVHCTDSD